jgi:light-regulated signal transduction histidine kinase (bacteriophytochrome)
MQCAHLQLNTTDAPRSAFRRSIDRVIIGPRLRTWISADDQKRIFDPFFTTKPDGTGLGLAISFALLERSGGKLRLVKSDSDGSVFELAIAAGAQGSTGSLI